MTDEWSLAISLAALVVAGFAALFTYLQYRSAARSADAAERSDIAARRSAEAAESAADAAERSATASELSAEADQRMAALAEADAAKYTPPWRLVRLSKTRYALEHAGGEVTYDAMVDLTEFGVSDPTRWEQEEVPPGPVMEFVAAKSARNWDAMVRISWRRDPQGPVEERRYPLPG